MKFRSLLNYQGPAFNHSGSKRFGSAFCTRMKVESWVWYDSAWLRAQISGTTFDRWARPYWSVPVGSGSSIWSCWPAKRPTIYLFWSGLCLKLPFEVGSSSYKFFILSSRTFRTKYWQANQLQSPPEMNLAFTLLSVNIVSTLHVEHEGLGLQSLI